MLGGVETPMQVDRARWRVAGHLVERGDHMVPAPRTRHRRANLTDTPTGTGEGARGLLALIWRHHDVDVASPTSGQISGGLDRERGALQREPSNTGVVQHSPYAPELEHL